MLSLLLFSSIIFAQEYTPYYFIYGFSLPALHEGQYALTLSPEYSTQPSDYTSSDITSESRYLSNENYKYVRYSLAASMLYGITDATTAELSIQGSPTQSYLNGNRTTVYENSPSYNSITGDYDAFSSQLTVAHRLAPNMEISAIVNYYINTYPSVSINNPTSPQPDITNNSSRYSYFNIRLNFTLLSNY